MPKSLILENIGLNSFYRLKDNFHFLFLDRFKLGLWIILYLNLNRLLNRLLLLKTLNMLNDVFCLVLTHLALEPVNKLGVF